LRYIPACANGQLAFGAYHLDPGAGSYLPIALDVLTLRGDATGDRGETGVLVCKGVSDGLFGQSSFQFVSAAPVIGHSAEYRCR
jgi:hypothetical protein